MKYPQMSQMAFTGQIAAVYEIHASVCNQETGLLLLELKLVSCSGLLHFFVLGAVCKGRQRG